ncbi:VanZ family protein [Enterococcus casseliflavus]|uniref:VanZ family protein n=1 Tax=Enterococcus casseliflavus TaxID=37734 RepID=UPI0022E6D6C5|nr:VanZ family protein [Enterococcus casseliflavus]MEB6087467.1 VanZ family protein [Enterococcus casseliflavus]
MEFLYPFSMSFFPTSGSVDFVIPLIQILLITFYLYLFVQSFISGFFPKWAIYIFYIIYCLLLIYLLFFKNIGIQGIEWNPLMFIHDLLSAVVLLNIVMFIPSGFLFKFNKKNLLLFILIIFLVEISQYVFALGIFDVGDIFTNTCGFIIGSALSETPLFSNFKKKIR